MRTIDQFSQKITEVQDEISNVTELLYQKRQEEVYQKIDKLLENLLELCEIATVMKINGENILFEEEKLKESLESALEAMEKGDRIVFADVLQYEISEQIQEWLPK